MWLSATTGPEGQASLGDAVAAGQPDGELVSFPQFAADEFAGRLTAVPVAWLLLNTSQNKRACFPRHFTPPLAAAPLPAGPAGRLGCVQGGAGVHIGRRLSQRRGLALCGAGERVCVAGR